MLVGRDRCLAQIAAYRVEVLPPMPNFLNKNLVQMS